jgi:hypothetical protein
VGARVFVYAYACVLRLLRAFVGWFSCV